MEGHLVLRKTHRNPSTSLPRKTRPSTFTGRKKLELEQIVRIHYRKLSQLKNNPQKIGSCSE